MGVAPRGRPIARILIDSPVPQLDRLFDYAIPPELVDEAAVGVRVKTPLRTAGRVVDGFIVGLDTEDDADRALSEIEQIVSPVVALPERLYRLARAVADRAAGSASAVLRLAIPKRMVRVEKAWLAARAAAALDGDGEEAEPPSADEALTSVGDSARSVGDSDRSVGSPADSLAAGAEGARISASGGIGGEDSDGRGHATGGRGADSDGRGLDVDGPGADVGRRGPASDGRGVDAGGSRADSGGRTRADVRGADDETGVAGSELALFPGLTSRIAAGERLAVDAPPRPDAWARLLAAAAADTLALGRSAVVAVPDHRDLERLHAEVIRLVPTDAVVRHDAAQTGPERYAGYLRTLEERSCIVIGNRSAVYAPVHALGLIAIWDDGDSLYEEPLAPYVHARDAALVRQAQEACALLFVGHTRTSDVQRFVEIGFVSEVTAVRRESANVLLSGTREEERGARIPSAAFRAAKDALEHGPVLVQVARPGYAPSLVCADCRHPARCATCGGPLQAHSRGAVPVCGWCGVSAYNWACQSCSSARFRLSSSGSERTADELGRAFSGTRVIIADGEHPVLEVGAEPALVVATRGAEPVADGGYRAVLLLDGERMLQSPDLRVGESCLRWWSNAAALASPGAPVHLAGVNGPVARALASWTHATYARQELAERAPLHLPPAARVARVDGEGPAVQRALDRLRDGIPDLPADAVLGPVPLEASDRFGAGAQRALVRFDYARGAVVARELRAAVVSEAVSARRRKDRRRPNRAAIAVRLDILDPEL